MKYCPKCATPLTSKPLDGQTRQLCPAEQCGFVYWNNPTPVVAAVIEIEQKALLVHNVSWPAKMFALVSGFLEANEDPRDAVIREIQEETNLQTHTAELLGVYPFQIMNQVIIAYRTECSGEIQLNEELDDHKLLEFNAVKTWEFGTGLALKDWLATKNQNA
ncbi:MAG: NUDIX domain-containing protein [Pseudomonadales bacterium]|nr:NUDIX domain-containing protein [Pseudomonadales bacterium]